MTTSPWGRSEKYHRRQRAIYALKFSGRRVYIGQTVDLHSRRSQHRRAWSETFEPLILEQATGTHDDLIELEYAWRLVARRAGFRILASPGVIVDPRRRATPNRWALARSRRWPEANGHSWFFRGIAWVTGILLILCALANR